MPISKIQNAAKISYDLHAKVYTDENKNRSVFDKIKKMVAILEGANLPLSETDKETLYVGAYLFYALNPKSVEQGKQTLGAAQIQKLFGNDACALITAFAYPHTPQDMTRDEQWEFKSILFSVQKSDKDTKPENKLAEYLMMAETVADLMAEQPAEHCEQIAERCDETLSKLVLAHRLRNLNPHMVDLMEKESVRLLSAYVPLWQKKLNETGIDGNVFAHLLRSAFAHVKPMDPWGRDKMRRVSVQTYVEAADKNVFEYKLKAKDDYLGTRMRVILQAAKQAQIPVPVEFVSDLLNYTLTTFPEQGKAYNTAATAIGVALVDYIADNADKDKLPDLLLKEMPILEGLETLAQGVNSKTYIFDSENLIQYNGTPRATQECYDIKEAVLMSHNSFVVNHARQRLEQDTHHREKIDTRAGCYDSILQEIMDRRRARGVRS